MSGSLSHTMFFDCDVFIGRSSGNRNTGGQHVSAARLTEEMDRLGIERAAVYHILAREYDPSTGNERLLGEISGCSRLEPVWVVLPHHTGEVPPPLPLVGRMLDIGVRMARMFPASTLDSHRFHFAEWCVGELLGELERRRIPLMVDFGLFRRAEPPWQELHELLNIHRDLPFLLVDAQGRNNRTLYALLKRHEQLYVRTGGFDVHDGIGDLCHRFGPERLVFGSGYPTRSIGGPVLQLERSGLGASDRMLVASGNLERLLANVKENRDSSAG